MGIMHNFWLRSGQNGKLSGGSPPHQSLRDSLARPFSFNFVDIPPRRGESAPEGGSHENVLSLPPTGEGGEPAMRMRGKSS